VKLCLTCHNPGTTDPATGNTVDLAVMIHKIHGGNYTANPYEIVGFRQAWFDFSNTRFPGPTGEAKECGACHTGATPLKYSRAACGACHDTVDWATHMGGQVNDDGCNGCHSGTTAYPRVGFVHSKLYSSAAKARFTDPGFQVTINGVTNTGPGQSPTVDFSVTVGGQPFDLNADLAQVVPGGSTIVTNPRKVQSFRFSLAGPTTDYAPIGNTTGNAPQSPATIDGTTFLEVAAGTRGRYTYTFPASAAIPLTASGSFAVGFEGYYVQKLPAAGAPVAAKSFASVTPIFTFGVTDAAPVARRAIVDDAKCDACHQGLGFHGESSRKQAAYCAFCHNAANVNEERAPRFEVFPSGSTSNTPESVQLSTMVHRIHAGAELHRPQILGGFPAPSVTNPGGTPADFSAVEFPNFTGVQNCLACHRPGTYALPADTVLPTRSQTWTCLEDPGADTNGYCDGTSPVDGPPNFRMTAEAFTPPQAAACTSCHDSPVTIAHAAVNTFGTTETCAPCHGAGKDFDVLKVHRPRP